jgi:hypothetical protein
MATCEINAQDWWEPAQRVNGLGNDALRSCE